MDDTSLRLARPPIVEAVLDINCDFPTNLDIEARREEFVRVFADRYPKNRLQRHTNSRIEVKAGAQPAVSTDQSLGALQFLAADEKQLVQVRPAGFSFNRLAPYTRFEDYLPEIERTWRLLVEVARPIQIREIHLRYINRIRLPWIDGRVNLDDYLKVGPRLPDEDRLQFAGFMNHHRVVDVVTRDLANITLTTQLGTSGELPIVFDIETIAIGNMEPSDWSQIAARIQSLRELKNRIFRESLTEKCMALFQ